MASADDIELIIVGESDMGETALTPEMTADGTLEIEMPDGGIMVDFSPDDPSKAERKESAHDDNLAEDIEPHVLAAIAGDLMEGIAADDRSRSDWLEMRAQGLKLLGLIMEQAKSGDASAGAPLEGMSTFRDPVLLEAVIRFMSNASAELLPAGGPVKIVNLDGSPGTDQGATDLEKELNRYLTGKAREYYPDTKRMLLMTGFGGSGFKKLYHCPLRNRPVSESVDAKDLIVSNAAVSIGAAPRVTHQTRMKRSDMIRMQILGEYRNVELSEPMQPVKNQVTDKLEEIAGVKVAQERPEDQDFELYECYCELDLPGYEHMMKGKPSGLPLPYVVTIDKGSEEILSIKRNWIEDDESELPVARETFVSYYYIEGFSLYGIGLLHILGSLAMALTATSRETIDAGMLANFPGFLYIESGATKQMSNHFRVPPGGGAGIKPNGQMAIKDMIMPLPYKEPGPAFMQFIEQLRNLAQRVGNMAEINVGEGRQNAPVGTTLALLDVATKVEGAVHKGLHASQAKEFQLLKELFREDPEALWRSERRKTRKWNADELVAALENVDMVPQADPNTPSHMHRMAKAASLKQLATDSPELYNKKAVDTLILEMMGFPNPEGLFAPPQPQQPDPAIRLLEEKNAIDREKILSNERMKTLSHQITILIEKLKIAGKLAESPEGMPAVQQALGPMPLVRPGQLN